MKIDELRFRKNVIPAGICAALLAYPVLLQAQYTPSGASQQGGSSSVAQLPLSGRQGQTGLVSTSQSTTNAGGGDSVNLLNSSVNVQGAYSGSTPTGTNTGTTLPLSLDYALTLGLRYNLGAVSQSNALQQAEGQRRVARSTLMPHLDSVITDSVQQSNLRTVGVNVPGFPAVVGPFNSFDAQTILDFVRLGTQPLLVGLPLHLSTSHIIARQDPSVET